MPIFSQGYKAWSGPMHGRLARIMAVAGLELSIQLKRWTTWSTPGHVSNPSSGPIPCSRRSRNSTLRWPKQGSPTG